MIGSSGIPTFKRGRRERPSRFKPDIQTTSFGKHHPQRGFFLGAETENPDKANVNGGFRESEIRLEIQKILVGCLIRDFT